MKTKLRLTLDVTYDCAPCDVQNLVSNLEYLPRLAAGEGLLSDGCDAVVDVWSYRVKVHEGKPNQPKGATMKLNVVGNNQTELVKADGTTVFFSYNTPVAVFVPGRGALCSSTKYNGTTSKHVNMTLKRWGATKNLVTQEEVNLYVD